MELPIEREDVVAIMNALWDIQRDLDLVIALLKEDDEPEEADDA